MANKFNCGHVAASLLHLIDKYMNHSNQGRDLSNREVTKNTKKATMTSTSSISPARTNFDTPKMHEINSFNKNFEHIIIL